MLVNVLVSLFQNNVLFVFLSVIIAPPQLTNVWLSSFPEAREITSVFGTKSKSNPCTQIDVVQRLKLEIGVSKVHEMVGHTGSLYFSYQTTPLTTVQDQREGIGNL